MRFTKITIILAITGCTTDVEPPGVAATEGSTGTTGATTLGASTSAPCDDDSAADSTTGEQEDHVTFTLTFDGVFVCPDPVLQPGFVSTYEAVAYKSCAPDDPTCLPGTAYIGEPLVCPTESGSISVDVYQPGFYLLEAKRTDILDKLTSYSQSCYYQLGAGQAEQRWFEVTEIDILQGDEFIVDLYYLGAPGYVPCYQSCGQTTLGCYPEM